MKSSMHLRKHKRHILFIVILVLLLISLAIKVWGWL